MQQIVDFINGNARARVSSQSGVDPSDTAARRRQPHDPACGVADLRRSTCPRVVAKDGQDAINRMETDRPDLVLADTNMPCVDGYELARWVRRQPT